MKQIDTGDRIRWAVAKDNEHGEFPGRHEVAFKNLTRAEAVQLLMMLDKLQTDRRTVAYVAGTMEISEASEPSTAAADFVASTSGEDDIYTIAARDIAASTRIGADEIKRLITKAPELSMPYGDPS